MSSGFIRHLISGFRLSGSCSGAGRVDQDPIEFHTKRERVSASVQNHAICFLWNLGQAGKPAVAGDDFTARR